MAKLMFSLAILLGFAFLAYGLWRESQGSRRTDPNAMGATPGNQRLAQLMGAVSGFLARRDSY